MNWQRPSPHSSPASSRRSSLTPLPNEVVSGASPLNQSDSVIDVRTPAQQRLKRLQTKLKEDNQTKTNRNVPTPPSSRWNTLNSPPLGLVRKGMGSPIKTVSPVNPVVNQSRDSRRTIRTSSPASSVMNRLVPKANATPVPTVPKPPLPSRFSLPLMEQSPPKRSLKRRSDSNHNHLEGEHVAKKNRPDNSSSPNKMLVRKILSRKARPKALEFQSKKPDSAPATTLEYANDVEMTEDVVQDEIKNLREDFSIKNGYGLSVSVDASNKLVVEYIDYSNSDNPSPVQARIVPRNEVDRRTALRIVVDTNIFILGTDFLTELMNKRFPHNLGYPIIVVPFVVLEELDKLKTKSNMISINARKANNFINEQFSAKNPQLQAQSAIERQRKVVTTRFADDEILNCCVQMREANHKVVLLSNDVNLRNKALFTDIQAFSITAIQAEDLELNFDNVL